MELIISDYIQVEQVIGEIFPVVKLTLTETQAEKLAEQIMEKLK